MKKLIATVICLFVITMSAMPLAAQTRNRRYQNRTYSTRYDNRSVNRAPVYDPRYDNDVYSNDDYIYDDGYIYEDNRSVWEKHRDKITTAAGAGGGAALGGLLGGKKGAIIGAIAGGAGAAIYTYKIRDKYPRY
ncbi:MAG TPA: hypothetical protein VJU86_14235 [Pyrinomonadaceae bacterium]|nr:hypothetical protein [Pyrinomonadaceae bacterium]